MMSISDMITRTAQLHRNTKAVSSCDLDCTWGELLDRVARIADGLGRLGIETGDRIAILSLNSGRYYECFFSTPWAGCALVPINTRLSLPEIVFWMQDSESSVLYIDDSFLSLLPELRRQLPQVKQYIYLGMGETPEDMIAYDDLLTDTTPIVAKCEGGDEILGIFYTGGTTGRSKGVLLSHDNIVYNTLQAQTIHQWNTGDMYVHAAPMFHVADSIHTMVCAMVGLNNCFVPSFEPVALMETIQEKKVKRSLLVPTMIGMLLNHPDFDKYDLSSVKSMAYGASPMPEAIINSALERLPDCEFTQLYGQTEAAPVLTSLAHAYHVSDPETPNNSRLRSAGQAVPGVLLGIFDKDGNPCPQGEIGEVWARGHNIMLGYNKLPDVSASTIVDGWLHTGDGGYLDEGGFLFLVDRVKDMIISGGENVYSQEVENAIYQCKDVMECAVIGIPHDTWGEQVHAVVRRKGDSTLSEAELIAYCKTLIANYKCPRSVAFTEDPLPLSGAGKILKKDIRAPYWENCMRSVN